MILVFVAIAYWVNLTIGLALVAVMGLLIMQHAYTGFCPVDLLLKPMGLKPKL
ncbi:MAG: hypothetical protein V3R82_07395 [Candidatus Hydrothermarchaeales archaeon]